MLRVPLWLQLHGIEAWNSPGRMVRLAAERAHLVTAVSRYTRRRFLEWAINDPSTVKVLPNTFEPRFFPGPKPGRLIERLGLENQKILLTVARLSALERYKGHDRVIAALPHVLAQHPNVMYLIVGDGDDRSRLECEADALGIAKHVRFVGLVPDDELADYYRMADVFIMPSTGEGFGIVFLEAAAAGLHVIGGNQDGSADALADGAIGVVTSPTSIAGITQELVSALANRRYTANIVDRFSRHRFDRHVDAMLESNCLLKY
jgi:phosphatidylinositol alpha-1,6-mannosyltransferase